MAIDERLRLNSDEYCSPETRREIDQLYPETIQVQGRALSVEYSFRPANADEWASENREEFNATITIPPDLLFRIKTSDIPKIGASGRPQVLCRAEGFRRLYGLNENAFIKENLDDLQAFADNERLKSVWYRFEAPKISTEKPLPKEPLPPLESLGVFPIAYAKNFKGDDVFAYPAYDANKTYNYDRGEYTYFYEIKYFRTKDEADESNNHALELKEQEITLAQANETVAKKIIAPATTTSEDYGYETETETKTKTRSFYSDPGATSGFGSILDRHFSKQKTPSTKAEKPATPVTEAKPKEKEKITTELRATLENDIANANFFLNAVRAIPEPDPKMKNADKISKVRARAIEIRRSLNIAEQDLGVTDNAEQARDRITGIMRNAERAAAEMAKLQNSREDWPSRFKDFMATLATMAKTLETNLDSTTLEKMKPKVAALAQNKRDPADLNAELEKIIFDSL